jgi:ABC-type bacteriocin/lantibiotic exporter with double-glycine peptidase domain
MVLAHLGKVHSEAELRNLLGTGPDGTRARNLLSLSTLDIDTQLEPMNFSQLTEALAAGTPPLVFVETGLLGYWSLDCSHVAVVVGITENIVYLNDPFFDSAPQQTSLAGFQQAWALNGHLAAVIRPRS